MLIGSRLLERINAVGLSQTELAKRVGVSQPTIHRLINGQAYGTTRLHQIARELGTTPAYLTGETDDPEADMPDVAPIPRDERVILDYFRELEPKSRDAAVRVLQVLADAAKLSDPVTIAPVTAGIVLPPEAALTEMFQGLLRAPQTKGKSGDALARGLARLLPSGLRQVQGPLRIEQTDAGDAQAERLEDQQHNRPGQRQASRK